jgi:hypothetical protein
MSLKLNKLEREAMELLLADDHEWLSLLRDQYESARIKSKEYTGAGFYIFFEVSGNAPRLPDRCKFELGDIFAEIEGLKYGAGFTLFIENGVIDNLEGYTYGEVSWPETIDKYKLQYSEETRKLPF